MFTPVFYKRTKILSYKSGVYTGLFFSLLAYFYEQINYKLIVTVKNEKMKECKEIPIDNTQAQTEETRKKITPECALKILKQGNEQFVANLSLNRNLKQQVKATSKGQYPFAAVLSCIDSRVPAELIFDQGIGDIFNVRTAGNFVDQKIVENNNILGSLEFAKMSGVKLILVLGHTGCGAIKAALGDDEIPCEQTSEMVERLRTNLTEKDANKATKENVLKTIQHIRDLSSCLREFEIVGGVYNISTGEVTFL